jgi:uncharacterized protein YjdB
VVAGAWLIGACSSTAASEASDVGRVEIEPAHLSVVPGGLATLTARVFSASGGELGGQWVFWSSQDVSIATVSQSGVVAGVAPGVTRIAASLGGRSGTAQVTVTPTPVGSVTVTPSSPSLVVGAVLALTATVRDPAGKVLEDRSVRWSSDRVTVATVLPSGVVNAIAPGTARISANADGVEGFATITVTLVPVATLSVAPSSGSVSVGQTLQLSATARDDQNRVLTGRQITWRSNDAEIASVTQTGLVSGVAVGATTITASVEGVVATATISVGLVPVASISLTPNPATVQEREDVQLTATPRDAAGAALAGRTVVWSSSNNAIAAVSQSGLATGIAPGAATITASSPGAGAGGTSPSASVAVTVTYAPVTRVQITPSPASVGVGSSLGFVAMLSDANGQTLLLAGRSITWSSLNTNVASVNAATGVATGVSPGNVTIRAQASSPGQSVPVTGDASLSVTLAAVASVSVVPSTATVHAGAAYSRQFGAQLRDGSGNVLTGRSVAWATSNAGVATVSAGGLVTGTAPGAATITATSGGVVGSAAVTVDLVAISSVAVTPPSATLAPLGTVQLSATPRDSANNALSGSALGGRTVAWTSSAPLIATVSAGGLVTALLPGSATISAAIGGKSGTSAVSVLAPLGSVAVTLTTDSLIGPGSVAGTVTVLDVLSNPMAGQTVTLSTSAAAVATVSPLTGATDAAGRVALTVTGVAEGTASVRATSSGTVGAASIRILAPIASVTTSPTSMDVDEDKSKSFTAVARGASGAAIAGRPCGLATSGAATATVSPASAVTNASGQISASVRGVKKGDATITVSCGGRTAAVAVHVK